MEGFGAPSGLVVNIILSGEQAKQEFQTFSNQMSEIMRDLKENIQSTNTVLRNMFSATKVNNFKKAVDGVNKSLREYNELIANSPASKLAETPKATDTKAAAEKAAKTSGAMANTFFDTFRQQAGQIMNTSLTSHAIKGTQSIIRAFGTIASWIGRIRVIAQSAVKVIFNLIKSPFTLISNLLGKVSNALGAVFKAFEWVQYQFFMQFMNIWLFAKTIVPILETFINYNREIYNTWAIAQEEWGQGLETIKQKLLDINDIELDTKFETLREDIEKNMGSIESFDLGKLMSNLGLSLAMEYGRMPQDVASAFYDMASATVEFNDVLIFTEGAIKASVAGVTTLTTAVASGISTVYAFGKEMEDLNKIYDYQFATVKYGIIRYEELAQVMGRVYAPAASLSDTFENMNEMYATMAFATRVGLSPEMSGFGLARLYESLSDSRVINNLKKLNVEVFDSIGNFRGLQAILGDLIIATKGFSTATTQAMLSSLGFDMRARRVMRSLMNNYGAYMALLQEFGETPVDNISGSMDEAFQKMQESFAFRVDQLKATWESLKITFSESILDTLVYYVDNVALAMRGLLGWLKEGTITIGGFSVSMGVLVKHLSLFYVLFAGIATVAGALKVATTPMGVFIGMFMALINSAGKNGLMFTALAERFEGLGIIIKTISDYVKIFFDLLKQDTPLKAFSTLLEMMFSDLSTVLTSMPHINNVIQAFKKLFSAVQGLFDSSKYAQTITDFFKETGKIPQNYGEIIAQRFGNIFNSIGKAVKQMLVDALGLELDDSQSILAVVIPKVYRLIMDVFAGIFGKETGTFGLKDLFVSIFETLGIVTRNSLGQAIVNKDFIRNIGHMFGNLLTESVKAALSNLPLFLTIAGFNISKEAFKSIFMMFNNLPALLSQTGLGSSSLGRGITFAGDFLKFYAVIEFFDAMFGTDLLKGLPPLIQTAIKVAVAGSGAFIASMIRAGLQGKLIGKVLQDSLGRAFKAGVVTIYATVVNIYTSGLNQPQGLSSPITTTVMSTAKGSISAYLALAIGAVAGVLGIAGLASRTSEKGYASNLDTQLAMQNASNKMFMNSLHKVSDNLDISIKDLNSAWNIAGAALTGMGAVAASIAASVAVSSLLASMPMPSFGATAKGVATGGVAAGAYRPAFSLPANLQGVSSSVDVSNLIREQYLQEMSEFLVKEGVIVPELKDIVSEVSENFVETSGIVTRFVMDNATELQEAFVYQIESLFVALGYYDETERTLDNLEKELTGLTFGQLFEKLKETNKYDALTLSSMISTLYRPMFDIGANLDTNVLEALGELRSFTITKPIVSTENFTKFLEFAVGMQSLVKFYGSQNVLDEYKKLMQENNGIDVAGDPLSIVSSLRATLEKNHVSTVERMSMYKKMNTLFINYFSDAIDALGATNTDLISGLKTNTDIQSVYQSITGGELTADTAVTLGELIDVLKKGSVSNVYDVRVKTSGILNELLAVLTQYAAEGDIDNLTAFYNTLIDVRNYLDLAAGNISKYVYDLMETVDQYFMLPTETGIKELNTVRDIIKNTENEHLLKNSSFWKALFTGDFTYLEQAKMSEENLLILKELFAETGNDKLEIAMRALYTSMGEGILNTVSKNLMEIANDPYYIKELNLSPKLFNADTSMFMEGTQYAKSFADPVDIFADYLIDMFTSMKDASETVRNFMEANITIEDPIKQALVEIGNASVGDSEAVAEATEALKTLLRTTTDKELEDFMKNSAETLTTLQLYLGDPALNAAFEAILGKDWRSVVADLKEPIKYLEMVLNIVPDVANAMREARKNLSSSTSFTGLAVSGSSSMQSFIDVDSELKAFLMIFGALFGKESIMGDIMGYKALSTSFGIADMKTELDASSLSDVGSLVEFVNTYASLLIEIGMLSEDLYVSDVATGLFQKISSKDLAQNINENLISTLEGFNAFSEFQAYFYREVGGRVEGNILSRDIPFAINKITELGVNLFNFVSDVIFGQLFNLEYWTSLMGSGASVGRIGLNLSKGVQINLESALYSSSKDYADNIINIFDSILKEDTFSSLIPDFIKQSIMNVSMGTGALGSLTGANVATVGYGIGEIADELLLDPEMVDKFISIEMESVKNISSAISDNIVKNLSGIFATLIDKYVPTALGKLNIPALSGILGIISGITSKFVGNFIARWVTETAATLGTELSVYLLGLNRNISLAQGQDFLTTEEVVKLSENILVDIVNFIGTLISASFEMISGGFDFDKFIGNISLQSVFSGTIDFISKMSEGSKKVISENILDFVSNTTPKGLTSLLNEYEAIPEGAKDQAAKLIEEQWDEIKLFAAEALFGSTAWKWLIDLLDIGIFRTAWQNVIGDIFSGLTKREDLSNDIWLGWGMGSGFIGQITNASLLDAITEYSPKQIVNTALEATVISYISSMKSLSDDLIKKDVTTLLRGAPPEITDLIGTMDIQKTIENVYDSLTEIIELPELFSRPEGDIGGEVKTIRSKMKVSKLDLWAGIQTGLLGEFESLDKLTLDQLDTQLTMMGMELTPEQRDILKDLQQSNWKSMAMFLKPGKLVEMGAEIDPALIDAATGEWKGILEKYIGVGRLTGQQVEEGNELVKEYMNQALEVVSNMGSVFNNMASSVEIIAEKWNFDAEILVKGLQSIGVVTDSIIAAVSSGAQAIEFQDRAKNTEGTAQMLNVLGAIGGWAGVIAAVLGLVAGLVQIWVDSQKITEQQLIAIRQNTVAIESLTNILDSMRLTMYGAPSGFIYGYTNPSPVPTYDLTSTKGVTFNIEALNINGSGDPDEIAAAVERGLVMAAKRVR